MKFEGSYCALVTPFDAKGRLDEDAYRALIRRQIAGGTAGLVPCGSTGEAATLDQEESRRALELACAESRGDVPVVAGIGTNATWKAVEAAREAESLGADALLVLAPYYNKPTQEGLFLHFRAVARATRLPVMLYNIPGRTAVNVSPAVIARLARDCANVVAVKEAAGSLDQVSEILTRAPKGFTVLSGDDSLTIPMMSVGARGVVSVVANVAPKQTAALVSAFRKGDVAKAAALHLKMFPLIKALFVETNPIPVKAALGLMGLCRPEPRLPLTPLSAAARPTLRKALKDFGLL
ncbi:MAG: 4-hydroxy-tetrahydrodipicolinate synthase [Elusimicrobia bacterium]|nr:4-hydroxy-tetrahydrodipicolinate synthase [Elusimicrobiota bacterium]